ncbi:MAG TPA: oligopeptide ABC transporter ATP-binding protein [Firmicutes bacterium]|jgi:peptide/nickel transport system ATP-binding protein|nr:oligopeptide ABC transporter ATP-binding protein [Bacillota bacterium]HAZ21484.1 oligopeptide ABC transporter ATP-binding protein [Bacillota bacterium]HBE05670.1 oligopeptide ABC transporter ATP-binding protein [Bacillota bacterium]HBG44151.1 oligopeptide ABC transporter ATP-binding protein [Bacillota bacterium]HBL50048.1 oligopeptide ABC transporter ATP-binding protein [Bacillota bacterium]
MSDYILDVKNLRKLFPVRRSMKQMIKKERNFVHAIDGVSFNVKRGEIFGLIGESGCGKTTTGKVVMHLLESTEGQLILNGDDVTKLDKKALGVYRRNVQMIFQDPYASMNPRFTIRRVLLEPLEIHNVGATQEEREAMIVKALESVKLTPAEEFLDRYPHMLSGGQRQRVATARTLILNPKIVVADEPVSMVDLSTRAELLQMMKDVQQEMGLTYIYITHDLSTARYFTDRIAVMYLGRIVELANADDLIDHAKHPYTKALIAAVCEPVSGKVNHIKEVPIEGEIPSAAHIPSGCRFHPRCIYAQPDCATEPEPELQSDANGHLVACRHWNDLKRK